MYSRVEIKSGKTLRETLGRSLDGQVDGMAYMEDF